MLYYERSRLALPPTKVKMTKVEVRRIAIRARTAYGYYDRGHTPEGTRLMEYPCPLAIDANPRQMAHRVEVHYLPWEKPTAAMVDSAFLEHLTDEYADSRCPHVLDDQQSS